MLIDVDVNKLVQHPKNNYYFDDMEGSKWDEFKESIRTSGIIDPIVITSDNVIVSGHQRVLACKELGITSIPSVVKEYDDEDAILKDLIEANIRQRGNIDSSTLKLGRIIVELKRIYGVKKGPNCNQVSSLDITDMIGISKDAGYRAQKLVELIPEMQDEVENGYISPTVAFRLISSMSKEDQSKLFELIPKEVKLSQKEVQDCISSLTCQIDDLYGQIDELNDDVNDMVDRVKNAMQENRKIKDLYACAQKELGQLKEKERKSDMDIAGEYIDQRDRAIDAVEKIRMDNSKKAAQIKRMEKQIGDLESQIDMLKECEASKSQFDVKPLIECLLGFNSNIGYYSSKGYLEDFACKEETKNSIIGTIDLIAQKLKTLSDSICCISN